MDIIRPQGIKKMTDIQSSEPSRTSSIPRLEEEYGEWFTVSENEIQEEFIPSFVPPLFEYTPKKKKYWYRRIPLRTLAFGLGGKEHASKFLSKLSEEVSER